MLDGTKFDRLQGYNVANLHYLVTQAGLIARHEVPIGWGLLERKGEELELTLEPTWQATGIEEEVHFLQPLAAKNS